MKSNRSQERRIDELVKGLIERNLMKSLIFPPSIFQLDLILYSMSDLTQFLCLYCFTVLRADDKIIIDPLPFELLIALASQTFVFLSLTYASGSSSAFCNFKHLFLSLSKLFFLIVFKSIIVPPVIAAKAFDVATFCCWC